MTVERLIDEPETATVKSAWRVVKILELFGQERREMSTTDVALKLDFPISSTAALLKSLASQGYLVFDARSRIYRPSLRVGFLGGWMRKCSDGFSRLETAIERLAADTGQTVILGIRNDINIQYVRVEAPESHLHFYLPVGSRHRLVDTTMGRALLAEEEDRVIERLVRRANAERTAQQTHIDLAVIREEVDAVRANGYAYSLRAFFEGAAVGAVPLRIADTGQSAVLGIGGSAEEIDPRRDDILEMLCDAAREIETPTEADGPIGAVGIGRGLEAARETRTA